jgi:hypothetical protein
MPGRRCAVRDGRAPAVRPRARRPPGRRSTTTSLRPARTTG